jgi:hypothetical protein
MEELTAATDRIMASVKRQGGDEVTRLDEGEIVDRQEQVWGGFLRSEWSQSLSLHTYLCGWVIRF